MILDFSQFLSGPSAALRLADLGARVIKVERPDGGDLCRQLYISNTEIHGDSTIFHAINRNKESLTIDLKDIDGINLVKKLIPHVDVVIQNFRPGVMERLGLDYDSLRTINPKLIYGSIMGYGSSGPWSAKPGQDLLVQALSGLPWLNGSSNDPPVPFGLSIADMSAGAHLAQGLLACLYRRNQNGQGGLVEVSLLESILDFQFEIFTTFLNDGGKLPQRSKVNSAHAYLSAPYGIYQTADGYLALAMGSVLELGNLLRCSPLSQYVEKESWFTQRDEIKEHLQKHLQTKTTREWLAVLETADYWCAEVLTWDRLVQHQGFKDLSMIQTVLLGNQTPVQTTRCPIRLNGRILRSPLGAPKIGEHTDRILRELAD